MRIRPPAPGEPFYNEQAGPDIIRISNRGPGEQFDFEARQIIDAGFLELVRYGVRRADDPLIIDSLKVVDHILKIETPFGTCWRRYNHDGYGQKKDGGPYDGWGQGRAWPLLTGERGHYELAAGNDCTPHIAAIERFRSIGGMLPEQIWDQADIPSAHLFLGRSAGAAQPLVWAHSEYLKLLRSTVDGRVYERISIVEQRYAVPPDKRTFKNHVEIFKLRRPLKDIAYGHTLRILNIDRFRVVYSLDNWATVLNQDCHSVGYSGFFADIPITGPNTGTIIFTLCWCNEGQPEHWLGRNIEVIIVPQS